MSTTENRYDFVYFFDCTDGNPNGDPDSDNSPRMDPVTLQGLVSDVCLKRKIRDYVAALKSSGDIVEPGYRIFVMSGPTLERQQELPYKDLKLKPKTQDRSEIEQARVWMCQNFFDVRAFGAVMSTTDFNCGQVRGPVQITFARSLDRIFSTDHAITRVAYTTEKKAKATMGSTEFGHKHTVAYGLYRTHGFLNPVFARQTGFSDEDLSLLWRALANMFDIDRSAARGLMAARRLFVFKHKSALGEAPAHRLFESVKARLKDGVVAPRSFDDYVVSGPEPASLPPGVELLDPAALAAFA